MLEFLINDFSHMIFCKFDQSISIFPYEKAVGHRLIVASALKELTNMAAMFDFVLISTFYLKNWWWKYILDSMALKKSFNNMMIMACTWFSEEGGGDASHNGRHLGFVEIRKGMISFLILLMSFLCRGTKIFFFNCKNEELWYSPVFFCKNDVIWCYITLNYRYVGFMLINSI